MPTDEICLIWSRGRLFSPSLSCRGQGIGKQRGTISSWHKRTAGRNLVVHRHGTTLWQSVQRYRCRLYFSLFFSYFDIKAGKSPGDIVWKEAFHSCPLACQIVDRYCVLFIALENITSINRFTRGGIATLRCPRSRACFTGNSSANLERFSEKCQGNMK